MTIMMMTAYRRTYLSKYRLTGRGNFLHQPVGLCKIATVKNFNINVKSETGSKDSHARFSSAFFPLTIFLKCCCLNKHNIYLFRFLQYLYRNLCVLGQAKFCRVKVKHHNTEQVLQCILVSGCALCAV